MSNRSATALRPSTQKKMEAIFEASKQEFFANGFAGASIEAIAASAGVSKVTIYNHFSDKKTLFREMLQDHVSHIRQNFEISNLDEKGLREILTFAGNEMINFLTQKKMVRFERMLGAEVNRDPSIGNFFREAGPGSLLTSLLNLLQAAIDRGEIQSDNLMHSAEMFPGLVMGRLDLMLRYGLELEMSEQHKKDRVERAVSAWLKIHQPSD